VQTENGVEWHCPALVGKKVGLFLQKVLYTKGDGTDGYKFEVRHIFQPGSRRTYAEYSENEAATAIAALEKSMKDKDDRVQGNLSFPVAVASRLALTLMRKTLMQYLIPAAASRQSARSEHPESAGLRRRHSLLTG
jgi:hypothetical protein